MKKVIITLLVLLLVSALAFAQSDRGLKVFISVDMEGITGIQTSAECSSSGSDYQYFRGIMTQETNAAIEGAFAAGATEVLVRDSHGSARNIIPDKLDSRAKLLRSWSGGPKMMMEGIDETFDAVIFIGYHAKAGTPNAIIEHTMSGNVMDLSINGVSLPEAGFNALIAGHYNVPVVFAAGDKALCEQAKGLFGEVETVAVKEGIGAAVLSLHPDVSNDLIRRGVEHSLRNLNKYKPYKLNAPYKMILRLKREESVNEASFYPGAKRISDWEVTFESRDLMAVVMAFVSMY